MTDLAGPLWEARRSGGVVLAMEGMQTLPYMRAMPATPRASGKHMRSNMKQGTMRPIFPRFQSPLMEGKDVLKK